MTVAPLVQLPPAPGGLLAPFELLAESSPNRVVALAGDSALSAGDLESRANDLALHLQAGGVLAGSYVGIGLDRSLDLIVALLAVVKAGAAYVPLDPAFPRERLVNMIAAAGLDTVISRRNHAETFSAAGASRMIDVTHRQGENASGRVSLAPASPDNPLYAIFTSGSTGQPKAASVSRKGFANLLDWYTGEMGLGADDTTLLICSPSFDLTQKNFFAPLITGGRLVLDDSAIYDISRISKLVREHRVTVLNCTPSALYPLVDTAAANGYADLASLRFVVLGGEPISIPRLRAWLEHTSCKAEVMNSYGPTEFTDICAYHRLHRGNLDGFPFVPLGREIPNVTVTIRDEDLAPVPDGELGELCIAGAGLDLFARPSATALAELLAPPAAAAAATSATQDRARLQRAGFSNFRRPSPR